MKKICFEYCKGVADDLAEIYNGKTVNDAGEIGTLQDYFLDNALDYEYCVDSIGGYKSVKIWVTYGGPNIWIDTERRAVCLAWGTDRAECPLDVNTWLAIDEIFSELYSTLGF